MRLVVPETQHNYQTGYDETVYVHNPKVDYVCYCKCGGYGTRSQYGYDEYCPDCGKYLDWSKEEKW